VPLKGVIVAVFSHFLKAWGNPSKIARTYRRWCIWTWSSGRAAPTSNVSQHGPGRMMEGMWLQTLQKQKGKQTIGETKVLVLTWLPPNLFIIIRHSQCGFPKIFGVSQLSGWTGPATTWCISHPQWNWNHHTCFFAPLSGGYPLVN
jgi:hypothetical protein